MKKLLTIILIAIAIFSGTGTAASAQEHRTLVWSDEFNYTGLPDSTKWTYEKGFVRNEEPQYYTVKRPANARVENGLLILEARKGQGADSAKIPFTSASITTRGLADWRYGRIEVRAKVPAGLGAWPAIWLLGIDSGQPGWPRSGEIDVMEFLGKEPGTVYGTIHYGKDSSGEHASKGGTLKKITPSDGFHIYALDWYPDRMELYYDSKKYFVFDISRAHAYGDAFRKKFYLLLNLALGHEGGWPGPVDQKALPFLYYIDYVRVYQ